MVSLFVNGYSLSSQLVLSADIQFHSTPGPSQPTLQHQLNYRFYYHFIVFCCMIHFDIKICFSFKFQQVCFKWIKVVSNFSLTSPRSSICYNTCFTCFELFCFVCCWTMFPQVTGMSSWVYNVIRDNRLITSW